MICSREKKTFYVVRFRISRKYSQMKNIFTNDKIQRLSLYYFAPRSFHFNSYNPMVNNFSAFFSFQASSGLIVFSPSADEDINKRDGSSMHTNERENADDNERRKTDDYL